MDSVARRDAADDPRAADAVPTLVERMTRGSEEDPVIALDAARHVAVVNELAVIEHERAVADGRQREHVVRDDEDRRAAVAQLADAAVALHLKPRIADGENFVDEQDV